MNALQAWRARRAAASQAPLAKRWVLIDTETSGLDPAKDRLIAAAGVAIELREGRPVLALRDSFELVFECPPGLVLDEVARRNILLHGVGRGEQRRGLPLDEGLRRLIAWVAGAPCLAFHAGFDAEVLERACQSELGQPWIPPWLDLAVLARVLHPSTSLRTLDDWLAHYGLQVGQRHSAASDAWVSAELLQQLWPRWMAGAGDTPPWTQAQRQIDARRWLA